MVLLNAGVYLLLTVAAHFQQLVNIPFEIDRDRPEVKQLLLRMTIVLKTVLMVLLAGLLWIDPCTRRWAGCAPRDAVSWWYS